MSESTVYSAQSPAPLTLFTPAGPRAPHQHQDNGSVVRFSKQALLQIVTHQRQSWSSVSGAATGQTSPGRGPVTRGHYQQRRVSARVF